MPTSLQGIAKQAASQPQYRFRTLDGRLDEPLLRECWRDIRKDAASGVDEVSARAYEQHLDAYDANIRHLVERLKRKRYRAKLGRRPYLPKGEGKLSPLGIPAVEDKLVQRAVAMVLGAIYEQDFRDCSYGFREGRSPHQALHELRERCMQEHSG